MILHKGERVYWGAPEVIYLEGIIASLDEQNQTVVVHIDRATPYSAHLIGSDVPFAADGVKPLPGDSPPGVTSERSIERQSRPEMSDEQKIRSAASVAVHEQYGYTLSKEEENVLIDQVAQVIHSEPTMRATIIASMDDILRREL
jgi:hypothetical protein